MRNFVDWCSSLFQDDAQVSLSSAFLSQANNGLWVRASASGMANIAQIRSDTHTNLTIITDNQKEKHTEGFIP